MAFDQNSVPMDLRPLNVAFTGPEETRIAQPGTTSCRVPDGFFPNPNPPRTDVTSPHPMAIYYTDATGFPGLGFGNPGGPNSGQGQAPGWASRMPAPVAVGPPSSSSISPSGYAYSPNSGSRVSGNGTSVASDRATSDDGGDDSVTGKKVKFLCSFSGKILPRPSDGMLRYVGGQTRIISVRRDVTFGELVQKMTDLYGHPVIIKYQLPDEDLDALVSVSCPDDLDNMMEEYAKLLERSGDGSAKLRVFLFSALELDPSGLVQLGDLQNTGQKYVDAVNGVVEGIVGGITRKESIASAASTQNSDMSGTDNLDAILSQDVTVPPSTSMFSPRSDSAASNDNVPRLETSAPPLIVPVASFPHTTSSQPEIDLERTVPLQVPVQQTCLKFPPPPPSYLGGYVDPHQDALSLADYHKLPSQMVYANPHMMGSARPILVQPQFRDNAPTMLTQQFIPGGHMAMAPASSHVSINPNIVQPHRVIAIPVDQSYNHAYPGQLGGGYGWHQVTSQDQGGGWIPHQQVMPRMADCYMCQKALPHAHSDTVVQDQKDGHSTTAGDTNPIYHSLRLDDIMRFHAVTPQNQGVMGLVGDFQNPYGATSCPEDTQAKQEVLMSKPVNGDNASVGGVTYQIPEQLAPENSKDYFGNIPGFAFTENAVRPAISHEHVTPAEFRKENFQINSADMLPSNEQGKSTVDQHRKDDIFEEVPTQTFVRETLPNIAKPSEVLSCSTAEVPYQHNVCIVEPVEVDTAKFQTIASSGPEIATSNWGAIISDSPNSLFSNEDPWNMRHEAHFPPPKPSKIVTKREVSATRDIPGENRAGHNTILEQVQSSKGSAEEQTKQQLQATAEGVAASVLHSASDPEFSSHENDVSVSEVIHEMEGQTNSDAVIQTKMEAMNIKPEKTNFGFPLSDGIGRLQIIKNSDLEELRELGSGTFGTVYHGKWRGTDVAIKRINDRCFSGKPSEQERMRDDFWNEAIKLADLHHPNVVAFYGVVLDGPGGSVATVTEFMVNGSLRTALQRNERNLDKRKRLLIAMDVAFGMEYLHSKNIVHFDLKSDNLLVNLRDPHRPICKVGDLGLSKVKCQTLISGGVRGTLPWMAPELLNGSSSLVSEKVDVFSFGIVMWELLTGEEPYADLHYGAIIGGIVSNTLRPPVPENCDPDWRSLMERCWSAEPSERLNFTEIANELRVMAAKVPPKGQTAMPPTNTMTNT